LERETVTAGRNKRIGWHCAFFAAFLQIITEWRQSLSQHSIIQKTNHNGKNHQYQRRQHHQKWVTNPEVCKKSSDHEKGDPNTSNQGK
jgi:hypothetical protein